jgi:hypothetical protein
MASKLKKEKKASPRYVYTGHEKFPDIDIRLTSKELKILFQQPPELMKLYIFLNLYRDFDTNITGESVHIDDTSFKLWIGYASKAGRKGWKPSTTHVVRWLEQLEVLGLIQRRGNNVFYLPLAHTKNHESNISHQGVTTVSPNSAQGVTNLDNGKTLINKGSAFDIKNEVSPNLSVGVTEVEQRLCTIPGKDITKLNYTYAPVQFLSATENQFMSLFFDLKLSMRLAGDLKAITAAKALAQAGVTLAEAKDALEIKLAGYTGNRTPHPSYFVQAVLDYKKDLENIKQQPEKNNETNRPRTTEHNKPRITHDERRKRMAEWAEKKEREIQEGSESDNLVI